MGRGKRRGRGKERERQKERERGREREGEREGERERRGEGDWGTLTLLTIHSVVEVQVVRVVLGSAVVELREKAMIVMDPLHLVRERGRRKVE